jgi:hypothetical protein
MTSYGLSSATTVAPLALIQSESKTLRQRPGGGMKDARDKPFDARDDLDRSEILEILKELPEDNRARVAHREGANAIALTHLEDKRQDLIDRLTGAWLDGYNRMLRRTSVRKLVV